jgi:hypothetical protein
MSALENVPLQADLERRLAKLRESFSYRLRAYSIVDRPFSVVKEGVWRFRASHQTVGEVVMTVFDSPEIPGGPGRAAFDRQCISVQNSLPPTQRFFGEHLRQKTLSDFGPPVVDPIQARRFAEDYFLIVEPMSSGEFTALSMQSRPFHLGLVRRVFRSLLETLQRIHQDSDTFGGVTAETVYTDTAGNVRLAASLCLARLFFQDRRNADPAPKQQDVRDAAQLAGALWLGWHSAGPREWAADDLVSLHAQDAGFASSLIRLRGDEPVSTQSALVLLGRPDASERAVIDENRMAPNQGPVLGIGGSFGTILIVWLIVAVVVLVLLWKLG